MGNPAMVTSKNLLGLAGVLIASAIFVTLLLGIFGEVTQKTQVKWINDEIKPLVSKQCAACFLCGIPGQSHDALPKNGRKSREFKSESMELEWKGENGDKLHLVTYREGEMDLSVRVGLSRDAHLTGTIKGCNEGDVKLTGNTDNPGLKEFKMKPGDSGRGVEINVQ